MRLALSIPAAAAAIVLIGIGCGTFAQKQPAPLDQDDDVLRISTNLVTVPISVMDRQGRFVPDLNESQFHLFEDGVEQRIAFFESAAKPFTVALLLDTSDSTRFKLEDIEDAALAFVDQLRADDRVLVAAFDKRVTLLTEATSSRRVLHDAIRRAQTGGGRSSCSLMGSTRLVPAQLIKAPCILQKNWTHWFIQFSTTPMTTLRTLRGGGPVFRC
ncbi:MAG: hypothetical protein DMF70_06345 [Acidobacteria bacterium]|nr:MAG: hypothetical protein DMF70_06345 [Acidobacteriota bacterium]